MFDERFIKPRYDAGGFAGIPRRIQDHFASGKYDAVVLFLVDGFGWRYLERFQDTPFIKRLSRRGRVEKLTSQFPSTTAAQITTIHTGLPVGESGVYEWFYYEPQLGTIIAPLLFSYAGDNDRDTLKPSGINANRLFPRGTLYSALSESGVQSYVLGGQGYTPSTYSNVVMQGARLFGFKTLSEALVNLGSLLEQQSGRAYVHFYFDKVDSLSHEYGPAAPQTEAEIEAFLLILEHFFERILMGRKKVLFLMTADHGAMQVDPKTTIFLNTDPHFAGVERFLRSNRNGGLLVPAGSPRDMFLYIKDELLDEAQAFLANRLQGRAEVAKVMELIGEGYFGPSISTEFRGRAGDLVILPYQYESVWWYVKNKFEQKFLGHHGGLSPEEMEIPFFTYEV